MAESQRFENVLLKVVVQLEPGYAFNKLASPVDVDAILPLLARLVDQWLRENVVIRAREFVEANGTRPFVQ